MKPMPLIAALFFSFGISSFAAPDAAGRMAVPIAEIDPFGQITLGGKYSDDLTSGYADVFAGIIHTPNSAFFVNLRGTFADSNQDHHNGGFGYRILLEEPGIILGANVFYDHIESAAGNSFDQLGLGIEVLSKWIDVRANYYIPEGDSEPTGSFTRSATNRKISPAYFNLDAEKRVTKTRTIFHEMNGSIIRSLHTDSITIPVEQTVTDRTVTRRFNTVEQALEGWNAEVGFLVPWVERYFDLRLFAGGYSYDNPLGGETAGFKARAEARMTQGITLDVEYWEDEQLVGGNWVGGVRVSIPFDFSELCGGRNPFAGGGCIFAPQKDKSLAGRLDEMVIRSHRIMTASGTPQLSGQTTLEDTQALRGCEKSQRVEDLRSLRSIRREAAA
jgi:hypothetical protein